MTDALTFRPDPEMFVCMDPTGCYHISWNAEDHAVKMGKVGATHEARYVCALPAPSGLEVVGHIGGDALRALNLGRKSFIGPKSNYRPVALVRLSDAQSLLSSQAQQIERLTRDRDAAIVRAAKQEDRAEAAEQQVQRLIQSLASIEVQAENAAWNIGKPGHKFSVADIQAGYFQIKDFAGTAIAATPGKGEAQ